MYKLTLTVVVVSILTACATATPFSISGGSQQNAIIKGDSGFFSGIPTPGSYAFLETINGKSIGGSDSSALVPPGTYAVKVDCEIHNGSIFLQGSRIITFTVEPGHTYEFAVDPSHETISGHSFFTKMFNNEGANSCKPFAYDATGGTGPYPETVHVVNPPNAGAQWNGSGQAYGGHSIQDWVPKLQSANHWNEMIEIEYWSRLMYPKTADALFHSRVASAVKQCPGTQLTVLTESTDQVIFEMAAPTCAANKVRTQLSRFMTGEYGIYEISYLSINPLNDADRTAWLQALQNAKTVIRH